MEKFGKLLLGMALAAILTVLLFNLFCYRSINMPPAEYKALHPNVGCVIQSSTTWDSGGYDINGVFIWSKSEYVYRCSDGAILRFVE